MTEPTHIQEYGNQLAILFDDGTRRLARPTPGGLWIVGGSGSIEPPDPPDPVEGWKWSFPESTITPGREWDSVGHNGIDFGFPPATSGAAIHAIGPGTVVANSWEPHGFGGGGYVVIVDHGVVNGVPWWSSYNHMDYAGPVTVGQAVDASTHIGDIGNSGSSFGAHLHLQLQQQLAWSSTTYDPRAFLDSVGATGK